MNRTGRLALWLAFVVLATGCDRFLSAAQRIDRAQQQYELGNYAAAMADVKTALEKEPGNAAGRALLARVSLRLGDSEGASKELERALAAGADAGSIAPVRHDILMAQGQFEEALATATSPLAKAEALLALGRLDEARSSLDEARAQAPSDPDVLRAEAQWLWARGQLQEAIAVLDGLLVDEPDDAAAALARGRYALALGDASKARDVLKVASEAGTRQLSVPDQLVVSAALVESQLALGDVAAADADLAALKARAPDNTLTHYLGARVAYSRGDTESAVTELQKAIASSPDFLPASLLLGAVLLERGAIEQAGSQLSQLLAKHPDSVEARKLLARVFLARNDPAGAQRVLADVPDSVRDPGIDWLTGSILLMSGETAEGVARLEQGMQAAPDNVSLRLDLVRAYLLSERAADARALLAGLPPGVGGATRQRLQLLAEVAGKDLAAGLSAIRQMVAAQPDDAELKVIAGQYLLRAGRTDEAAELFAAASKLDGRNREAQLGLAGAAVRAGDTKAAESALGKVLEIDPADERASLALAAIEAARGNRAATRARLESAIGANPGAVESRLRLAELDLADKDPVKAESMFEQSLAVTRNRPQTLYRIGQILLRGAQYDAALKRFNEAASLGVAQAGTSAALTLAAMGRPDEARGRLEALVRENPANATPVALLVQMDQREADGAARALKRIAAFEKAGGNLAVADELRGDVLLASGRAGEAADAYARVAASRPRAELVIKRYSAEKAAGRARPEAGLVAWLEDHPGEVTVRIALADFLRAKGDTAGAIAQYEKVADIWQGPAVLNNLAWFYYEVGDSRAEEFARRAYEKAQASPEIADTYGWILVEKGRIEQGLKILEAAAQGAARDPEVQYHYASALARAGKSAEAAAALRRLIEGHADFPSRGDAEALLKTLT